MNLKDLKRQSTVKKAFDLKRRQRRKPSVNFNLTPEKIVQEIDDTADEDTRFTRLSNILGIGKNGSIVFEGIHKVTKR